MISMPSQVFRVIPVDASLRVASRPHKQRWLAALCAVLAALFCAGASIASAQTAHFSGAQTTLGSGFDFPTGVAVDSSGNVYVADYMNNAVKEILAVNGTIPASPTIVTLGSGFNYPVAVALDGSGNLYVAEQGPGGVNPMVEELLAVNGSIPASPTIRTLTPVSLPGGIAVDGKGNLYVTEACYLALGGSGGNGGSGVNECGFLTEFLAVNGSLPASPNQVEFGNSFNYPGGVVLDSSGNVYVADEGDNAIKEILAINGSISVNSQIVTLHTFTGTAGPAGLELDASGDVFVTDFGTNDVYELLAVNGSIPSSPAVITLGSGFNEPYGATLDASGNLYVADSGNNRVVKLSLSGGNFGSVNIGATSTAIPMTFTFDTAGTLGGIAVLTQGATGLDFKDAGTGTCRTGTAYTEGQTCTINVTFTPRFAGTRTGAAVLYSAPGSVVATGNVQGIGVGPQINFLPGGTTTVASFSEPEGVAVDNSGNVYVSTDSAIYEMLAVNGNLPASPTINTLTATGGRYYSVAVDGSGNVYAANYPGTSVIEIEAVNGTIPASPTIRTLASSFNEPEGVAVDSSGNVYVADTMNRAIEEIFAVNGTIPASPTIRTLATVADSAVGFVAVDTNGNVYFDCCSSSLMEIEAVNGSIPASPVIRTVATGVSVEGIAVDGSGNVFTSDISTGKVNEILAVNGSIPASPTVVTLNENSSGPAGVAVDGSGNVYVAYPSSDSVAKLNFAVPPSLTFADTAVGSTSSDSPQTVTVTNVGNAPLTFPILSTGNNPSIAGNFTLNSSGASACPLVSVGSSEPGTLAAGASCQLPISFMPAAATALSGSLVLTDNNLNAAAPGYTTQTITLSGDGFQPLPSFTLSAAPGSVTLNQGASSTSTITVNPTNGFIGGVTLAALGLPSGVTASFTPNPATGTSVLTLTATSTAPAGIYNVTIAGKLFPQTVTANLVLTIISVPSFSLDASPASLTIVQGGSGTSGITVTDLYGFTGSVQLAASGLPSGVAASFTPNPTTGTSTLTLTASSSATLGQTPVTITGTSGTLAETAFLALTVNPMVVNAPPLSNFGAVSVGTTSPVIPLTFTVVNGGTLGSTAVLTQGAAGLDFADSGSDTCVAGTANAAGQTCTVNVTFTPRFAGTRYGAVVLNDTNGNVLATGYLQGTGVGPQVNFLPNTESTVASSGLASPEGVAVDGSGTVYISDVGNNVIWKATLLAGSYVQSAIPTSTLNDPVGVAVDGGGNVYIADTGNNRVLKETPSPGGYTESVVANLVNNGILSPISVAVDGNGNVYFFAADSQDYEGNLYEETPFAGSYIQSTIPTPGVSDITGIAVDGDGNVYITDSLSNLVGKETLTTGVYTQSLLPASGLSSPNGVAVDGSGNVYIAYTAGGQVIKETLSAGSYIQSAVSTSPLDWPLGVAVDGSGNVYITDNFNLRVLKEDFADAPSLSFASAAVGSTSTDSPQTVTVENVGNAALSLPIPSTGNNPSIAANFNLNRSGAPACPMLNTGSSTAGTLAAAASCLLPISFAPTAAGALSGSLVLTDNNLNAAAPGYATQTILLSGTGTQATPTITWATPAAITYGTALSATQLNASSTVAGTFTYSPAAGTVLGAGQQTLTVTFAPTDSTDYTPASASVTLTVNKATPTITWATPAAITYGTALNSTQLDATANVSGAFAYSPAAGTVPAVGTDTLTVTFTPADSTDYTAATASVVLKVNPAPSFTLGASPASLTITQGASGKSTIAVTGENGFTGEVTLAASGLPGGVTASFATNPTTGISALTFSASNTAVTGTYNVTIKGTSGSLTVTTTIALTVNGFACHIAYTIETQWKGGFEAAITIHNTGVKAISNWTLTWTFASGQKITDIWDGTETQSGANVTVTNMSYNGSIPAGSSYTGLGFNASWNNTTNAVPISFAVNGTTCK